MNNSIFSVKFFTWKIESLDMLIIFSFYVRRHVYRCVFMLQICTARQHPITVRKAYFFFKHFLEFLSGRHDYMFYKLTDVCTFISCVYIYIYMYFKSLVFSVFVGQWLPTSNFHKAFTVPTKQRLLSYFWGKYSDNVQVSCQTMNGLQMFLNQTARIVYTCLLLVLCMRCGWSLFVFFSVWPNDF